MIHTLNENFVNTWVILRDLTALISGSAGETVSNLARNLQEHYTDSVDIFVLTPEGEVLLHQPELELPQRDPIPAYLKRLQEALGRMKRS